MNMINADVFVGAVAIVLGMACISVAVFNWNRFSQLQKARWIESLCGRSGARFFFVVLGLGLILLGCAVAMGYVLNRSRTGSSRESLPSYGLIAAVAFLPAKAELS